ncbi:MAG: S41 family peptidase [Anaerotignum sp.]|nr:S41 family peptidase [Anaerotignum sp.]
MKKEFWKGFGAALVLVLMVGVVWKPICRMIPWNSLPFEIELSRGAKAAIMESYLEKYYVEDFDESLVEEMLYSGMVAGVGDRYTYYLPKENLDQYMENANGNFDGVGIEVYLNQENEVVISHVMEGQPAEEAGLKEDDIIVGVDGEDMRGKMVSDVAAKIRGKAGTEVTIEVLRKSVDKTLEFTMERKVVEVESVKSRMMQGDIGYISISGFKENTYDQFKTALDGLQEQGMKGLVLDIRNNPGGLVKSVYQIGEELLPEGTMVYTLDKKEKRSDLKCDAEYLDIPLVVLVNENSASAAEILSGAVKDTERGTLVGVQTFGKGLVQRLFTLPDGSGLNVTIQKYYTPNGTSIHGVGVAPDVTVELPEAYQNTSLGMIPEGQDSQLQKALEVMGGKLK